jgi:hypothetical protein
MQLGKAARIHLELNDASTALDHDLPKSSIKRPQDAVTAADPALSNRHSQANRRSHRPIMADVPLGKSEQQSCRMSCASLSVRR